MLPRHRFSARTRTQLEEVQKQCEDMQAKNASLAHELAQERSRVQVLEAAKAEMERRETARIEKEEGEREEARARERERERERESESERQEEERRECRRILERLWDEINAAQDELVRPTAQSGLASSRVYCALQNSARDM